MASINNTYLNEVKEYYNKSQRWYSWFYSDSQSLGMHYGFWDNGILDRTLALIQPYKYVLNYLKPKKGEKILDAGCGVGGASLWLATESKSEYVGITLSEIQLEQAQKNVKKRHLENQVSFLCADYSNTDFLNNSFDGIFGLESFCYSYPNSKKLFGEMHRILKPKGKIVMLDGVFLRHPANDYEQKLAKDFCRGFRLAAMSTPEEIISQIKEAGFSKINFVNKTDVIKPSVLDLFSKGRKVSFFRFFKYLGIVSQVEVDNLLATESQMEMYNRGLFGYGIFYAEK